MDAYDAIPFLRQAVPETHPDHLAALAWLFGLEPRDPRHSRVLELGCAAGANLLPMAWFLPEARFLGLDQSTTQVAVGQTAIAQLGLSNIEIRLADVAQVDLGESRFDYIIAHGIYSWVPRPVREALLRLISRHLAPDGVAYISFNALPGWRMRGMLRDMLLFRVRHQQSAQQQISGARELLAFLGGGLAGLDAFSAGYLRSEVERLNAAPDAYLYHEYLAPINDPQLFADFVAAARTEGMDYLCNAELQYQFPAALSEEAELALSAMQDPLVRQQYLDFLLNRNFHQALLVRPGAGRQGLDYERFAGLALFADLAPPQRLELGKVKAQNFTDARGQRHPVSHPLTKAAVAILHAAYPGAIAYPELETQACRQVQLSAKPRLAADTAHLFAELFQLFAQRLLGATRWPGGAVTAASPGSCLNRFAAAEMALGRLVDSRHATLDMDPRVTGIVERRLGSAAQSRVAVDCADERRQFEAIFAQLARRGALQSC